MEAASLKQIKELIKRHEGYRLEPYRCTENKLTGGYGHVILPGEEAPTDKEGWEKIFEKDFDKALEGAARVCEGMDLPDRKFGVFVGMAYQLGEKGLSKFKNALAAAREKKWELCALEMIQSKWHTQTKARCEALADIIQED
jgi:lysozyme